MPISEEKVCDAIGAGNYRVRLITKPKREIIVLVAAYGVSRKLGRVALLSWLIGDCRRSVSGT